MWDAPALKELNVSFNLLSELPQGAEPLPTPPPSEVRSQMFIKRNAMSLLRTILTRTNLAGGVTV
jgi:hypothetical protein